MYIKRVILKNFKCYKEEKIFELNPNKNILIGDNGVGKTSLIQAIKLALKGTRFEYNGISYLAKFINNQSKQKFYSLSNKKDYTKLPSFSVTVVFGVQDSDQKKLKYINFCGEYQDSSGNHLNELGIYFRYYFNEDFKDEYAELVKENMASFEIPFSMYKVEHKTFADRPYFSRMDPLKSIFIDNDRFEGNPFNIFAKQIYDNLDVNEKVSVESKFRIDTKNLFEQINNKENSSYKLKIDADTLKLSSIVDVQDNNISLQELGSGEENLLKTKLSIDSDAKLIVVEEPENHLTSNNTRKQIDKLRELKNQLIVTTHNSRIVTGIDLNNIIWINKMADSNIDFNQLSENTKNFFIKRDDIDYLRLITSKRIILVEGAAEYILMRTFINKILGEENSDIEVMSMRGRYYKPFAELSKLTGNKMVIFTDNDFDVDDDKRTQELKKFNDKYKSFNIKICYDEDPKCFTFEAAEYYSNQKIIDGDGSISNAATSTSYRDHNYPVQLAYMLNNKTKSALKMISSYESNVYKIPKYICEGLRWLRV